MKKITPLIFGLLFGLVAVTKAQFIAAQDVPAEIHQDFTAKFPDTKRVDWEKDGNKFKASFNLKKYAYQLTYDDNGKLLVQQYGIPTATLPVDVTDGLKKNFPDLNLQKADKIEDKGRTSYKCVLADANSATESVYVSASGMIIKTEVDQ